MDGRLTYSAIRLSHHNRIHANPHCVLRYLFARYPGLMGGGSIPLPVAKKTGIEQRAGLPLRGRRAALLRARRVAPQTGDLPS